MSRYLKTVCLKFSAAALFLLILQTAEAQKSKKNEKEYGVELYPDLAATLTRYQKQLGSEYVALIWRDTMIFRKESGDFNLKSEAPLAGASKWLTTALIMLLAEEGKLSLDDKITQYLPIYSNYGKNYITIRHCLSHFTGIQMNNKLMENKVESLEDEAVSFAKREIQTNPGTEFNYNTGGFMIAGRIAEIVTKKKFDQLIKSRLFNPMGMSKTTFSQPDGSGVNPSDGARTTAYDYIRFLSMLLHNGKYNGKQILSEESVKEMRRMQTSDGTVKFGPRALTGVNYALGSWVLENKDGEATALLSSGIFGIYPVVDWCRGYAFLFLPKELLKEQEAETIQQIKGAIDGKVQSRCTN